MKRVFLTTAFFVAMVFLNSLAFADDIGDLKKQIQELRNDYEGKIQKLQAQVDALSSKQEAKIEEEV